MTVEAAHPYPTATGELISGIQTPPEITQPQIKEQRLNQEYEYPLQQRIDTEWANLFGEDFTLGTNIEVFKDKVRQFQELAQDPNAKKEDLLRKLSYIKIGAISIATSMRRDIHKPVEKKLMEKMQVKYPPDAITELRLSGKSTKEACSELKYLHENGETYLYQGIHISPEEQEARKPRRPSFRDAFQDISDTWQRASYGSDLPEHDSMGIVINEMDELVAEFYDGEQNLIYVSIDEEKQELILGEIADVIISGDGKFSDEGECVEEWQNFALDRMIDTYGDLPKLRRMGVPTQVGMDYLRKCRHNDENGIPRPIVKKIPDNYKGPNFRITSKEPPEQDSSLEMLH